MTSQKMIRVVPRPLTHPDVKTGMVRVTNYPIERATVIRVQGADDGVRCDTRVSSFPENVARTGCPGYDSRMTGLEFLSALEDNR